MARFSGWEQEWRTLLKREPCVWCGRRPDEIPGGTGAKYRVGGATVMTIEHIIPASQKMRPPGWENLAPACWNCNNTRGDLGLLLYVILRRHRGRVDQRFIRRYGKPPRRPARWQRRADRPELPPPARLTFTIGETLVS